jgi:capsular exopolysaccharide synthesis family protein
VFQKSDLHGLTFMASGPLPPNPAELLASPKMLTLLSVAAEEYDIVILDGPPVAGLADAPLLSSVTAGTLLVIDAARTRRKVVKTALKRLHFARAQVVGAVVNRVSSDRSGYGYAYGGYGYGGDAYYGEPREQISPPGQGSSKHGRA